MENEVEDFIEDRSTLRVAVEHIRKELILAGRSVTVG